MADLTVRLGALTLRGPVLLASGTAGCGCVFGPRATRARDPSVNRRSTCSHANSFWYCLTSAFFGSRRIRTRADSSSSSRTATTGRRPTNSGISPYR